VLAGFDLGGDPFALLDPALAPAPAPASAAGAGSLYVATGLRLSVSSGSSLEFSPASRAAAGCPAAELPEKVRCVRFLIQLAGCS
jgi:hypothetical protein